MAGSLQQFIPSLATQDIKRRIQLGSDILSCLRTPSGLLEFEEIGFFIDSIASWINNSNFKVAQNGIEIMTILAEEMKEEFKPYISTIFTATVDRLGDSKDQVRLQAKQLMLKLMNPVSSPQYIFDKLNIAFCHKNFRVREEVMVLLQQTLDQFGSSSLTISRLMPSLVKLLADPNSQVRDTSMATLVHVYKHVGERLRHDISKRAGIPPPKMQLLFTKFDEVKAAGALLPSAMERSGPRTEDETDSKSQSSTTKSAAAKRASSAPPVRRTMFTSSKSLPSSTKVEKILEEDEPKKSSSRKILVNDRKVMKNRGGGAGGADEEMFIKSFEDVPRITLYSAKELETELTKIKETLGDPSNDWEKRVEMCKRIRSVIVAGGHEYDEFFPHLRLLEHPFQTSVKDLRSQVVREACISIAFLSQQLGSKLDHFSEALLPCLINLIPNSAKIMSTAGIVAIRFIIRYTHVRRLIPIITTNLSSKSKDIRKTCFEFLDQLLVTWPTHLMERHVSIITDAIRKGISDADPEARAFSRKAYWSFADHFREHADALLNSLDNSKQRMLHDELTMSNSSSSSSLTQSSKPYRSTASNHGGSVENLNYGRTGTLGRRTGISNLPISKQDPSSGIPTRLRSTSAIDLSAVRRAKARASYSTVANLARGSGASLPRTPATRRNEMSVHAITSPERVVKSRPRGSSQSQPHERRLRGSRTRLTGAGEKYPTLSSSAAPLMAERTLQQSREAEVTVADALRAPTRRRYNAFDDQSDESETSSVCSDRSFSSFGRSVDITTMDSIVEVHEDVSDPLKHLLSLDWNSSVTLSAIENNFEANKSVKRVRFSDEVEKISYDSGDEKNLDVSFSHEENSNDRNNDTEMTADLLAYSDENKTNNFNEEEELTNFELPCNADENTSDSVRNDLNDNSLINSENEIKMILQGVEDSVNENANQNDCLFVDNYENVEWRSAVNLKERTIDLNEVTNQVENLCLEKVSLENITSVSPVEPVSKLSDFNICNAENPIDELKSNTSDGSSINSKRRVKNQKQSWRLNSVLTENSCYSSASELNSAVFKAWCEIKNKTETSQTTISNEKNASKKHTASNSAYLIWKKSKAEALKKAKRDKSSLNYPNMHQENSKNSKEEIEMAFKAWKKKKDEILKQKLSEKFDEDQEQVVESLMEKKEKKMEADAAFTAWKQHKSHLIKMEKKKRAWVMQKKREEEEKKIARDREALVVYQMWLESKNSEMKPCCNVKLTEAVCRFELFAVIISSGVLYQN